MSKLKLISWNVNGIRSVHKKGFIDWLEAAEPDILGLQETKISEDMLTPELIHIPGYTSYWTHAQKKGYSGVAIFTKEKPLSVQEGLGKSEFDQEGRVLVAEYADFILFNIYFPNGQRGEDRLQYKLAFYDAFLDVFNDYRAKGKKLVVCGDFNTADKPIDLARPKENEKISGFLPIERAWMDKFVEEGYLDTFRIVNPDIRTSIRGGMSEAAPGNETSDGGIDYFFTSPNLESHLSHAGISQEVLGSDHCPVTLELAF